MRQFRKELGPGCFRPGCLGKELVGQMLVRMETKLERMALGSRRRQVPKRQRRPRRRMGRPKSLGHHRLGSQQVRKKLGQMGIRQEQTR